MSSKYHIKVDYGKHIKSYSDIDEIYAKDSKLLLLEADRVEAIGVDCDLDNNSLMFDQPVLFRRYPHLVPADEAVTGYCPVYLPDIITFHGLHSKDHWEWEFNKARSEYQMDSVFGLHQCMEYLDLSEYNEENIIKFIRWVVSTCQSVGIDIEIPRYMSEKTWDFYWCCGVFNDEADSTYRVVIATEDCRNHRTPDEDWPDSYALLQSIGFSEECIANCTDDWHMYISDEVRQGSTPNEQRVKESLNLEVNV